MPIIKSAKKRVKQEAKRRERNKSLKTYMKNLKKHTLTVFNAESPKQEDVLKALDFYKSRLDRAWSKGIFKRNKSSRLKSRMDHLYKKMFNKEPN